MANTAAALMRFFWAGVAKPRQTGALLPSQRFLIAQMIAPVPEDYRGQIVELGAGNGALTLRLAARCPEARILACEINPSLAYDYRYKLKATRLEGRVELFTGLASRLLSALAQRAAEKPDYIISGIPLGNLGSAKAVVLLDAIHQLLAEGGTYIQFQHSLLHRRMISARFRSLRVVPVFLNLPPAVVYYARK